MFYLKKLRWEVLMLPRLMGPKWRDKITKQLMDELEGQPLGNYIIQLAYLSLYISLSNYLSLYFSLSFSYIIIITTINRKTWFCNINIRYREFRN